MNLINLLMCYLMIYTKDKESENKYYKQLRGGSSKYTYIYYLFNISLN